MHCEARVSEFKRALDDKISKKKKQDLVLEKSLIFNDSINNLIVFPARRRRITEEDFSRLKAERTVTTEDDKLRCYKFEEKTYQCESYLQQSVLLKFLLNNTFKSIKTQSLKIPFKNSFYHPDFQCMTHDNLFVIIEIKPILKMCESINIEKFKALKEYCQKYGFGYLIISSVHN